MGSPGDFAKSLRDSFRCLVAEYPGLAHWRRECMTSGKIRVKRLKLSDPMVGISIRRAPPYSNVQDSLCHVFANNSVNLTFITSQQSNGKDNFFCCVIARELSAAKQLLDTTLSYSDPTYRIIPSVSLLSVFPHQSDIHLVCQLLQRLWAAQIPVHAVASSIAALTLVVDTNRIQSSVETLEKFLDIQPEDYITY